MLTTQDEWVEATRAGIKLAASRGVGAIHDKDGWLGAPGIFQRLRDEGNLSLRVWGSIPHELLDARRRASLRSGFGDEYLRIGYLKCFMDGTLGSQTALLTDGTGVEITSRAELEEIIRRGAERGWPVGVHAIGDQANRNALDAFEATRDALAAAGLRHRIEHAQCLTPEDSRASPSSASRARCSSLTRPPTATSPTASGRSGSTAPTPSARCSTPARSSRTAPMRPSRSSTRSPGSPPACSADRRAAGVAGRRRR